MDDEEEKLMSSLSFITTSNPEWDKRVVSGLRNECEVLTGIKEDFQTYSLYVKSREIFAGAISVEQHGNILWIDSLWIEPHFRKQGIGKMLIEKVLLLPAQHKVKEVQLNTYFKEAHDFFLNCGFEDVAIISNWKYGLTCYLLRKRCRKS